MLLARHLRRLREAPIVYGDYGSFIDAGSSSLLHSHHDLISLKMAKNSRARLLCLAKAEYQPDVWQNQDDVVELLSLVSLSSPPANEAYHRCRVVQQRGLST